MIRFTIERDSLLSMLDSTKNFVVDTLATK